jgi:polysaccharide export outer membrane protein
MIKLKSVFPLFLPILFFSCTSIPKTVSYFQDLDESQTYVEAENKVFAYEPTIKNGDQLLITISSPALDQEKVAQFNLPLIAYLSPGETRVQPSTTIQTYLVNKEGDITFPVIGKVQLSGLTKLQASDRITKLISDYVEEPIVNLQIVSFYITVLGDVRSPGRINVSNERISILEAIGAAGDLTIYGKRENVLLIRDNNGKKEFVRFDLTKSDLFSSPYFYLQQNDIIVVEPNKTRKLDSNYGSADGYRISMMSIAFTAVSIIVSVLSFMKK